MNRSSIEPMQIISNTGTDPQLVLLKNETITKKEEENCLIKKRLRFDLTQNVNFVYDEHDNNSEGVTKKKIKKKKKKKSKTKRTKQSDIDYNSPAYHEAFMSAIRSDAYKSFTRESAIEARARAQQALTDIQSYTKSTREMLNAMYQDDLDSFFNDPGSMTSTTLDDDEDDDVSIRLDDEANANAFSLCLQRRGSVGDIGDSIILDNDTFGEEEKGMRDNGDMAVAVPPPCPFHDGEKTTITEQKDDDDDKDEKNSIASDDTTRHQEKHSRGRGNDDTVLPPSPPHVYDGETTNERNDYDEEGEQEKLHSFISKHVYDDDFDTFLMKFGAVLDIADKREEEKKQLHGETEHDNKKCEEKDNNNNNNNNVIKEKRKEPIKEKREQYKDDAQMATPTSIIRYSIDNHLRQSDITVEDEEEAEDDAMYIFGDRAAEYCPDDDDDDLLLCDDEISESLSQLEHMFGF